MSTLSDQSNKADGGKIKPRLLIGDMAGAIEHVSAVLTYGVEKYEECGWREVDPKRYEDALLRHYLAWNSGNVYDEESGLLHLAHLACNAMFLLQLDIDRVLDWDGVVLKPEWNKPPQSHKNLVTKDD